MKSPRITACAGSPLFSTYCSLTRAPPGDLLNDKGERPAPVVDKCEFAPMVSHGADGCVCKVKLGLAYGKQLSAARLLFTSAMNMKVFWTKQNDRSDIPYFLFAVRLRRLRLELDWCALRPVAQRGRSCRDWFADSKSQ